MALDIWLVSGGDMTTTALNAVATFINNSGWRTLVWLAEILGVLACVFMYIKTHDLRGMFAWGMTFVIVTSLLLTPKTTIIVNDLTRPDKINRVDNVPIGLAVPLWLLTGAGHTVATSYETFFHLPDERAYSKTGMLFASKLMEDSFVLKSNSTAMLENFTAYVKNCVVPDIQLNQKYDMSLLMNTQNISSLIFTNASPIRGVYYRIGTTSEFMTCLTVSQKLRSELEADTKAGGTTFVQHAVAMLPGNSSPQSVYPTMLEGTYSYFFGASTQASDILKQNVAISALRRGLNSYSKSMNDTASMVDIASEMSLVKLRMSHSTGYRIATEVIPQMHTIFMLLCISIFPVMALALFIKELTWAVVKNYLNFMGSLMLWPVMFSIFNFGVNFSAASSNATGPTLANLDRLALTASTTGGIAGWLMISIPFLSFGLFTRLGQSVTSAGSYLGNALSSSASADAGSVASGNLSWGNVQYENINGQKRDINSISREGMVTEQLSNGAMVTRTSAGQTVYDTSQAQSKLPIDINLDRSLSSAAQKMTRESEVQTQTALAGYNHSVTQNSALLKQFHEQFGNSDAATLASATGLSSNDSQRVEKALNIASEYMNRTGASAENTFTEAQNKGRDLSASMGAKMGVSGKLFGGEASINAGIEGRGHSGSSSSISEGGRSSSESNRTMSVQEAQAIRDGIDVIRSNSSNFTGTHVDNSAAGLLTQISAGLNTSDSKYQQYSDSLSRTRELQGMASLSDNISGQTRSNYTQEFVQYVQSKTPEEASEILTNTDDPEVRARREEMAQGFVKDKIDSRVNSHYEESSRHVGDGLARPYNSAGAEYGGAYVDTMRDIDSRMAASGIKTDLKEHVGNHYNQAEKRIHENEDTIDIDRGRSEKEKVKQEEAQKNTENNFRVNYHAAELHQASWSPLQWESAKDISLNPLNVFKGEYKDYVDDSKEDIVRGGRKK